MTISYSGAQGAAAAVTIFDLSGRMIDEAGEVQLGSQTQSITWNRGSIPAGIYICQLSSHAQKTQLRFTVLR